MKRYIVLFVLLVPFASKAQINESTTNQVYEYLYRMAQKGIINIDDYILPLDRSTISSLLDSLNNNTTKLSPIEKKELAFYMHDFSFDNTPQGDKINFLDKNKSRPRFFSVSEKNNVIMLDPVVGVSGGKYGVKSGATYFGGLRLYGKLGKNIGFNFFFRDVTEVGDSIDVDKYFNSQKGTSGGILTKKNLNYGEVNFNIGYRWKTGLLSVGKESMLWGYSQTDGNIVLSNKAPSYPYIRLDYYPFKWLHFNYIHGWLLSDVIDSSASSIIGTGVGGANERIVNVQKFIAHHSITVTPTKGLNISLGESMVYSDKFDIGYLIPINLFKSYDHYVSSRDIRSGGNGQFFAQISSRNHIKNTHLYATLFIDEIRLTKIFSKIESRNQLGYTIGANKTDIGLRYLTLGIEYTHINPFVYNNVLPAQIYTSHSFSLGDWMGNNADRIYLFAKYTPIAKLKMNGWFQYLRKGAAGTLVQQYQQQPQPSFLFDKLFNQTDVGVSVIYEWIQTLKTSLKLNYFQRDYSFGDRNKGLSVNIGFSYGL